MGFFKALINVGNAEGVREAMRLSYRKHRRLAASIPHETGLFGALASRYVVRGDPKPDEEVWAELGPFLMMEPPDAAVEALAEYAVLKERPLDAKLDRLRYVMNVTLAGGGKGGELLNQAAFGFNLGAAWVPLLEPVNAKLLDRTFKQLQERVAERIRKDLLTGDTNEGKQVILSAIGHRRPLRFLYDRADGPSLEVISPSHIREVQGQEVLVGTLRGGGTPVQVPLRRMSHIAVAE